MGDKVENLEAKRIEEVPLSAQNANVFIKCMREYDWLKNIIVKGYFQYRYVTEYLDYLELFKFDDNKKTPIKSITFPMLCFCDIPLNQLEDHYKWYGNYAICMEKSWGFNKKLEPLHYVINYSEYVEKYNKIFNDIINDTNSKNESFEFIFSFLFLLKHFKGPQFCKENEQVEEKIFMDEQEWRSIKFFEEDINDIQNFYINVDSDYALKLYNQAIAKLDQNKLEFNVKDIRYIIVNKEEDVIKLIEDINNSDYDSKDKSLLISKINVLDNLREDLM
ncbi:abortive infection system antitoxin AbiGi family protein [Staphylococcus chromogenes]|uniref:abortive infection system antitoxin AbiGi family protein n=1 Tax=Staphylococcus chromogenes TaxID=46126 RepID=UPI00188F3D26|nr:abortive infection system antitoxin AbiGi family protein [Staphylococcus chromogenes]